MAIDTQFIRNYLLQWEDKILRGYIPCKHKNYFGKTRHTGPDDDDYGFIIGASGVTIGTGVDLGQNTAEELRAKGVAENLITKFQPYFRKTTYAAAAALFAKPLTITAAECEQMDSAVHNWFIKYSERMYNRESRLQFADIPREAQAVIVDLRYQVGSPNRAKGYPKLWKMLIAGDWKTAEKELKTGFHRYEERRKNEGKLLAQIRGVNNA